MAASPPPDSLHPAATRWPVVWAGVALAAAALAAYHNSFSGPLVFDDITAVAENPSIRHLASIDRVLSPPRNSGAGGRPLANLTYAINYAIGGDSPRVYHATNFLLHVGAALVLFGIVRRTLLRSGAQRRQMAAGSPIVFAFGAALLWMLHPLTTASVTYISQRTELLMGLFHLLTLYGFIRAAELYPAILSRRDPGRSPGLGPGGTALVENGASENRADRPGVCHPSSDIVVRRRGRWWLAASVAACAIGMAGKEVMVTAPVMVLLYDRTFVAGSFRAAFTLRRGYYGALGATWLFLAFLMTTGLDERGVGYTLGVTWWQYAMTECKAVVLYLRLALWPHPLIFDYGALYESRIAIVVASALVLVVLLAGSFVALWRRPALGFAACWVFILLAPTSTVVPVAEQPIAENRMYLPLAGVVVLALAGLRTLGDRPLLAATLPLAAALGTITAQRNADYRDDVALWTDTIVKRPLNPRAHYNAGLALLHRGEPRRALGRFEEAARLNPGYAPAHSSIGTALLELDRPADAIVHYENALRLDPGYPRTYYNYGLALFRAGEPARAIAQFQHALRLDAGFADAHASLGNTLFELGRPADAIAHYEQALRINPALVDAHYGCGNAYFELGKMAEAIAHFAAAVRLDPDDPELRNNYGGALLTAGRKADAIAQFEHALRLQPGYADAQSNLELARATAPALENR